MDFLITIVLVFFSALFSGLTLGFFSLNKDDLERKAKMGDKDAGKVFTLRKNGNLLLTTLLIGNVAVNATLSIYLGSIASGVLAGLIATALIVVFGEILPQSIFARYALVLGSRLTWIVNIFKYLLLPISWPIAWTLDKILGEEMPTVYSKHELIKLIEEHEELKESDIDAEEERIVKGALSFSDKRVRDIMTPRSEMYALAYNTVLNNSLVQEISNRGHSRIPVYKKNRDEIVAILYAKDLVKRDWQEKTVGDMARKEVFHVEKDKKLDELLENFKKTRHHLFVVMNQYGSVSGIVTIEDVIEEIIGEEIVDEYDKYEDLQQVAKKKMENKDINKV